MKEIDLSVCRWARCFLGIVLLLGGVLLSKEAADSSRDTETQTRDLHASVLSDPTNSSDRDKLAKLQGQEQERRRQALDALVSGLNYYVNNQLRLAREELKKVMQVSYIVDLANMILLTPLEDIMAKGGGQAGKSPGPAECTSCYGSGWAACRGCGGVGVMKCPGCRGVGRTCSNCEGMGAIECQACAGEGFVKCTKCSPKAQANTNSAIGANERDAVERLIAIADYLRSGGIDYFTGDGLKCSPRLQRGKPAAPAK
jgi:hypothetical protein